MMYKIRHLCALVFSIFLYAYEMWTLTTELQKKIQVMELRCYCKIAPGISFTDLITNEQVCKTIRHHIGLYEALLMMIKKRKLRWYGHVTRSSGLAKIILQETVGGKRCRGRWGK